MPKHPTGDKHEPSAFSKHIGAQERRKLKAQRKTNRSIWFGFAMSGLIGWSVVMPTLLGIALGIWLDKYHPGKQSWTLSLLVIGIVIGCWNAWHWMAQEEAEIRKDQEDKDV